MVVLCAILPCDLESSTPFELFRSECRSRRVAKLYHSPVAETCQCRLGLLMRESLFLLSLPKRTTSKGRATNTKAREIEKILRCRCSLIFRTLKAGSVHELGSFPCSFRYFKSSSCRRRRRDETPTTAALQSQSKLQLQRVRKRERELRRRFSRFQPLIPAVYAALRSGSSRREPACTRSCPQPRRGAPFRRAEQQPHRYRE